MKRIAGVFALTLMTSMLFLIIARVCKKFGIETTAGELESIALFYIVYWIVWSGISAVEKRRKGKW